MDSLNKAIFFRKPNFHANQRLFFLSYAGAGASVSEPYYELFKPDIDVVALQLPGREDRIEEAPISNMDEAAIIIAEQLLPFLDMPFSFWGHCSGALIAYEVVIKIRNILCVEPQTLIVSASAAPHQATDILPQSYHSLSDIDLIDAISELMGDAFTNSNSQQQLIKILLPGIRADFTLYETYCCSQQEKLDCHIYAIGGDNDNLVDSQHLQQWENYSRSTFNLATLPDAHHYFINDRVNEVVTQIKRALL